MPLQNYAQPAEKSIVDKTLASLKNNGFNTFFVETSDEANKKVLELIPEGAEVMEMTSETINTIDLSQVLRGSKKKYLFVREKLNTLEKKTSGREAQRMGAAPEVAIGSVHAVTQDGKIFIASATGSQLPAYVYGADKVIWIIGTQKIVKDADEAMKRIYEYTLPLESERAKKAYGVDGSFVAKLLMIHKEFTPDRITIIFVNKNLGF